MRKKSSTARKDRPKSRGLSVVLCALALFSYALLLPVIPAAAADYQAARIKSALPPELEANPGRGTMKLVLMGSHMTTDQDRRWDAREVHVYVRSTTRRGGWHLLFDNLRIIRSEDDYEQPSPALGSVGFKMPSFITVDLPAKHWLKQEGTIEFKVVKGKWNHRRKYDLDPLSESNVFRLAIVRAVSYRLRITQLHPTMFALGSKKSLSVRGKFGPGTKVLIGRERCETLNHSPGSEWIECRIPQSVINKEGIHFVSLRDPQGAAADTKAFWVRGPTRITRVSPIRIKPRTPGAQVTLHFSGYPPDKAEALFKAGLSARSRPPVVMSPGKVYRPRIGGTGKGTGSPPRKGENWVKLNMRLQKNRVSVYVPKELLSAAGTLTIKLISKAGSASGKVRVAEEKKLSPRLPAVPIRPLPR